MIGIRESRLKCMLDKNGSWHQLNDEDREAIQWALDRIKTLEEDVDRARAERYQISLESATKTKLIQDVRVLVDSLESQLAQQRERMRR
jgi:hypothetical protein